jgi:hypothetical protein
MAPTVLGRAGAHRLVLLRCGHLRERERHSRACVRETDALDGERNMRALTTIRKPCSGTKEDSN